MSIGSRKQGTGIGQVGEAIQELDRMTEQNAALVQETATASAAMKEQATTLAADVSRFRLPA